MTVNATWVGAVAHVGKCIVFVFQIVLINRCITADHLVIVVHEE